LIITRRLSTWRRLSPMGLLMAHNKGV
jgi:hypothetical protein